MKAIECQGRGEPSAEILKLVEVDVPEPKAHQVLIKVEASAINYADIMMTRGLYSGGLKPPFIPGFEVAGTIEKVGDDVKGYQPGQRVAATLGGGGYAEFAVSNAATLFPLPDSVSYEEGAAFPVAFMTAWHCLKTCGRLEAGESVLINAAAGGVGTAAVQLARIMEAKVYATASSAEKLKLAEELGADVCINYVEQDFKEVIQEHTDGRGVDVVLESVGGDVLEDSQRCLAPWGRLVVYGAASVKLGQLDSHDLLFRNKSVIGFHLGHLASTKPELNFPAVGELNGHWQAGKIRPIAGQSFALENAVDAIQHITQRQSIGKVILKS
jgi:NADPH2:quinone reductase